MRKYDDTAIKELLVIVGCGSDDEKNEAQKKIIDFFIIAISNNIFPNAQ